MLVKTVSSSKKRRKPTEIRLTRNGGYNPDPTKEKRRKKKGK